eukprot:TRINITY_DN12199_c0_g1_i1.p1 TRINITY_DN12199_c0_g1~~TRINITY_DN12199_c0_g1_i1.p1  ORF type:complete len:171 (-),score=63.12 TRINITY_DN12199_c0_g1_i1:150-662(-)
MLLRKALSSIPKLSNNVSPLSSLNGLFGRWNPSLRQAASSPASTSVRSFFSTMTTNWNSLRRTPAALTIRADDDAAGGKAAEAKKTSKKKEAKAKRKINFAKVFPQLKLDDIKTIKDVPVEFQTLVMKYAWETVHKPEPTLQDGKRYFRTIRRKKIKENNAMREMGIQIK